MASLGNEYNPRVLFQEDSDPHNSCPKVQTQGKTLWKWSFFPFCETLLFPQRLKTSSYGVSCCYWGYLPFLLRWDWQKVPVGKVLTDTSPLLQPGGPVGCLFSYLELSSPIFSFYSKPSLSQRLSSSTSSSTKPFSTEPQHRDLSHLCIPIIISVLLCCGCALLSCTHI